MTPTGSIDCREAAVAWLEAQGLIRVPGWETPARIVFAGSCSPALEPGERLWAVADPQDRRVVRHMAMIEFDSEACSVNDLREAQVAAHFAAWFDAAKELKRRIESMMGPASAT